MSIFTTPVAQLTMEDLQELLLNSAVENVRLEFKSEVPNKLETLKKLSSFSNTFGGFVVVGAKASSTDGRLSELPGVPLQNNYRQQVVQWCFDGVSPPLVVEVSDPIPQGTDTDKVLYVIYVPESEVAPHFVNERKGVWVRTDEFSQRYDPHLADENEILHLLDRRHLIQQRRADLVLRSQQRFEKFLTRRPRREDGPVEGDVPLHLQLSIGPRFPARPVCEQARIRTALDNSRISWRRTTFPSTSSSNFISQHESILCLLPTVAGSHPAGLLEANIWAMLFYATELEKRTQTGLEQFSTGIFPNHFAGHLLLFIKHAGKVILDLGYEGSLLINVKVSGIYGIQWLRPMGRAVFPGPCSEMDDSFTFSLSTTSGELGQRRDALVIDMMQYILFAMNWPEYAGDPEELKEIVRNGHLYNGWQ